MTESSSARSSTLRAIGPCTPSVSPARALSRGTRPGDGLKPTTLQKLAGLRSEPPRSVPSASGSMPQASATAAPPLLPPQVLLEVVGVARRAEQRVERLRARAEFRRVGLADDDRAGAAHAVDVELVRCRDEVAVQRGAERRAQPARQAQILDRDRQAVQRAGELAGRELAIGRSRVGEQLPGGAKRHDRVDRRVDALDLRQECAHDLDGRELAPRELHHELPRRCERDLSRRHGGAQPRRNRGFQIACRNACAASARPIADSVACSEASDVSSSMQQALAC